MLKVLTLNLWLFGFVIMIPSLGGSVQVSGSYPASGEVLARGVGALLGTSMVGTAFMIYRGFPWVRLLIMGALLIAVICPLFDSGDPGKLPPAVRAVFVPVLAIVVPLAAYFYLYRSRKAVRHFTGSLNTGPV